MWAQYGHNHSGVCLVFDKEKLIKSITEAFPEATLAYGRVEYKDRGFLAPLAQGAFVVDLDLYLRVGAAEYAERHVQAHHKELFFEKLRDWRDENEWRIVLVNAVACDCFLSFGDALVGVMHGADTPRDVTERLISLSDEPNIEHMGLLWSNPCPWYDLGSGHWCYESRRVIARMAERNRHSGTDI